MRRKPADDDVETAPLLSSAKGTARLRARPRPSLPTPPPLPPSSPFPPRAIVSDSVASASAVGDGVGVGSGFVLVKNGDAVGGGGNGGEGQDEVDSAFGSLFPQIISRRLGPPADDGEGDGEGRGDGRGGDVDVEWKRRRARVRRTRRSSGWGWWFPVAGPDSGSGSGSGSGSFAGQWQQQQRAVRSSYVWVTTGQQQQQQQQQQRRRDFAVGRGHCCYLLCRHILSWFRSDAAYAIVDHDPDDPVGEEYYFEPPAAPSLPCAAAATSLSKDDPPSSCSFGTSERDGVWLNTSDPPGCLMSLAVWIAVLYGAYTVVLVSDRGGAGGERWASLASAATAAFAAFHCSVSTLALASHAKTSWTDPGSIPKCAIPIVDAMTKRERQEEGDDDDDVEEGVDDAATLATMKLKSIKSQQHTMCSKCQSYKPKNCHHCRICKRCVARMDHHCPWMNNCVGAANLKHFILFLLYAWIVSASALFQFAWNFALCHFYHTDKGDTQRIDNVVDDYYYLDGGSARDSDENDRTTCKFGPVLWMHVRLVSIAAFFALVFLSSMILNVAFTLVTGVGTIDRLKRNATDRDDGNSGAHGVSGNGNGDGDGDRTEPGPIDLEIVFGMGPTWTWFLPVDPAFRDYDHVMGFSSPQRLLRERLLLPD